LKTVGVIVKCQGRTSKHIYTPIEFEWDFKGFRVETIGNTS
jgi:hypothetical protein